MQPLNCLNLWGFCAPPSCTYDVHWRTLKIQHLQMWYYSKWSQNVRMLSPLKRRHPAYVTLLVKSPFCPQCCKNLPHIVHHIYFWTTTCKHIIALPVFIGKPTSFRNGFNHTLYTKPIKRLLQAKHSGNNQNLSWWSRFKRISIRQNQAWQKRKQITDKSITNKDANKRRFIANNKKGCTQTAYVGSLVTMLVLHDYATCKRTQ